MTRIYTNHSVLSEGVIGVAKIEFWEHFWRGFFLVYFFSKGKEKIHHEKTQQKFSQ